MKNTQPRRLLLLVVVTSIVAGIAYLSRDCFSLGNFIEHETQLRIFQRNHPILAIGGAFFVYVVVTALSIPGAAVLTIVYGWYFGFPTGLVLVSFASTSGATLAFLTSRYFLRDLFASKFADQFAKFDQQLEKDGPYYLLSLRLIPAVPFFVINIVMGLTKIRWWMFFCVSQIGMFPGTVVYVYAGSTVPDLKTLADQRISNLLTPPLIAAFVLLGLFPLAIKKLAQLMDIVRTPATIDD